MSVLMVPELEREGEEYPTLGPQVCDWIEAYLVHGPGDLRGQPARLDAEKRALVYRMYEVFPQGHAQAGRRRFKRVGISLRKGTAKTEFAAWIAAVELDAEGPVRCDGFDASGNPVGRPVVDPYIPLVAYTEEQSEDLAYGALLAILEHSSIVNRFDLGLDRIMRIKGDGKAVALASAPNARDGARTTFEHFDEPLALATPVPTPTGWTTIGDIAIGNMVLGRDGTPVLVLGVSPTHFGRTCYRVRFTDGTSVITDGGHRWRVIDRRARNDGERTTTTEQMAAEVALPSGKRPAFRWAVPQAAPLDLPELDLAIPPYVLGVWLGDGDARGPVVSQSDTDLDALNVALGECGITTTRVRDQRRCAPRLYLRGLRSALRAEGLLGAKSIPARYLRASIAQRLELLRGLMDTDGHATPEGWCTLVTKERAFADQVAELLRTLGFRPSIQYRPDSRSRTREMVKVSFQAGPAMVPFRLPRKAARCRTSPADRQRYRSIIAIERVDDVPVRCIGVDSADHLFLVGEGMVPTHNTHRFTLPRLKQAHTTMLANLPKRFAADAWCLETTTAYEPGANSIAEETAAYAREIAEGRVTDPRLFYFHRQASDRHDLTKPEGRMEAIVEASGPAAAWSDLEGIASQWQAPKADVRYLERVWLNRPTQGGSKAFSLDAWRARARAGYEVPAASWIVLGFDGSRRLDATALIATEIVTGYQWPLLITERPHGAPLDWLMPAAPFYQAVADAFARWNVWRFYCDPPYWESAVDEWAGLYGEERVIRWYTNRWAKMAYAVRAFANAMQDAEADEAPIVVTPTEAENVEVEKPAGPGLVLHDLSHSGDPVLERHIGNAHRMLLNIVDERREKLWVLTKERGDSPNKIDGAVAAVLSWEARRDARAAGIGNAAADSWSGEVIALA